MDFGARINEMIIVGLGGKGAGLGLANDEGEEGAAGEDDEAAAAAEGAMEDMYDARMVVLCRSRIKRAMGDMTVKPVLTVT